jgi:hypothetical protein
MKRPILMMTIITASVLAWFTASYTHADAGDPILLAASAGETQGDTQTIGSSSVDQTDQPAIMVPNPLFTFEAVVDGSEVVHDFPVYNRGTGDLAIEKVQTG